MDQKQRPATPERLTAFLDSNVIYRYLAGDAEVAALFSERVLHRFRYAVNPIVLQEVLLGYEASRTVDLDRLSSWLEILQVDSERAEELSRRWRALRNWAVHSNDLLILASAEQCDYLVTLDSQLAEFARQDGVNAVSPTELLKAAG